MTPWVHFSWLPGLKTSEIHAEDVSLLGIGVVDAVVQIVATDGEWTTINFGDRRVRVKTNLLHPCPAPKVTRGQLVETVSPRSPLRSRVRSIQWHHKRKEPVFLLDGKKSRYFSDELSAV
jgi:hypothetical protein